MSLPTVTIRQLLEAGVHFGHQTRRWNPKMKPYIFTQRGGIHILNIQLTVPLLNKALSAVRDVVSSGGRVLFVGTKQQASALFKEAAQKCGQYYINHRWLGGTLTNWKTVSQAIKRLKELEERLNSEEINGYTKKERLSFARYHQKLDLSLGGIKDMGGVPDILFVIDSNKENIAIQEARALKIPVVAILDSNSDPDGIDYPIPGNDDALRAVELYAHLMSCAVLDGLKAEMRTAGIDVGSAVDLEKIQDDDAKPLFGDEQSASTQEGNI